MAVYLSLIVLPAKIRIMPFDSAISASHNEAYFCVLRTFWVAFSIVKLKICHISISSLYDQATVRLGKCVTCFAPMMITSTKFEVDMITCYVFATGDVVTSTFDVLTLNADRGYVVSSFANFEHPVTVYGRPMQ